VVEAVTVTALGSNQARWQAKLDREFPNGLVQTHDTPDAPGIPVSWVEVTGMAGLDPRVHIYAAGVDRPDWANLVITSVEEVQSSPVRLCRVTFKTGQVKLWTALRRTERLAKRIAPWRAYEQAEAHGEYMEYPA
jgi:hypothetical protein